MVQLSHPYMTPGKTTTLTGRTFVIKVMSLFFNMLSRYFLPRSKHLSISWPQSLSAVILEPKKIVCHCFHFSPFYLSRSDAIQPAHPVIPFSFCLQSCPASGSFPMSQIFASGGQSIGASSLAPVLPMNIQG